MQQYIYHINTTYYVIPKFVGQQLLFVSRHKVRMFSLAQL